MPDNAPKATLENVRIIFRNFTGRETQINQPGDRNFCAILPEPLAAKMLTDGWNVKHLKPQEDDEGEVGEPYLPVKVGYKFRPPKIIQITSVNRTNITEDIVGTLDWVDILNVDITVRGYHWEMPSGTSGLKAYLQSMYITIDEDELDRKYAIMDT